jgi:glycerol-3-phosphate O-acyltransferase
VEVIPVSVLDHRPAASDSDTSDVAVALDQVINRLAREFSGRCTRAVVADLVRACRSDLASSPPHAIAGRVERLARLRLRSGWASLLIERE